MTVDAAVGSCYLLRQLAAVRGALPAVGAVVEVLHQDDQFFWWQSEPGLLRAAGGLRLAGGRDRAGGQVRGQLPVSGLEENRDEY